MRSLLIITIISILFSAAAPAPAAPATPLTGKNIALDAGHGGSDPGAVNSNPDHPLFEKDMDIAVANLLKEKLEKDGAKVIMIRNGDETVGLQERVARANASPAEVLISIHHNSAKPGVNGTETYFSQADDQKVAAAMNKQLVSGLKTQDRGVKHMPDFVLTKGPKMPSTITEASFVTSDAEAKAFRFGDRVEQEATALHQGLAEYFQQ